MIKKIKKNLLRIFQVFFLITGVICITVGIVFIFTTLESNKIFRDTIRLDGPEHFLMVDVNYTFSTENIEFEENYPIKVNVTMTAYSPNDDWKYCYVRLYIKSKSVFSSDGSPSSYDNVITEKQWLYPQTPPLSFNIEFPMDGKYWPYVELYDQVNPTGAGKLLDSKYGTEFNVYSTEEDYMKKNELNNIAALSTSLFVGGGTFISIVIGLQGLILKYNTEIDTQKEKLHLKREKLKRLR